MSRKPSKSEATEAFGSDSFLDVVANMVGILIILVMVVGLRVKYAAEKDASPPPPTAEQVLAPVQAEGERIQRDLNKMLAQMRALYELSSAKYDERAALAYAAATKEEQLKLRRAQLASDEREVFDVRQAAILERSRLEELETKLKFLAETTAEPAVKIKTYPTPLSRTVYGREAHFQLLGGRIVYVPLNELVEEVKHQVQQRAYRLRDLDEITETVGPIGDFRLRYSLEKVAVHGGVNGTSIANGGVMIRTSQLTLVPVRPDLGETLEQALAERSEFRRTVGDIDPRRVTITLWTYPDSFDAYRALREVLYQQGYTVAGRPLPMGQPISGSPNGSKSAAQ